MNESNEALVERLSASSDDRRTCPFVSLHTPSETQADKTLIIAFDHRTKGEEAN